MAKVLKRPSVVKKFADGGEVPPVGSNKWIEQKVKSGAEAAMRALASPSRESQAAGEAYNAELRARRDRQEAAEGRRLEQMPSAPKKKKPYTNPDGTPYTREQMRKALGR